MASPAAKRVNLRTPDVMSHVEAQVESHYRSSLVERIRAEGGCLTEAGTTIRLAKEFGFCYGVERAIDLAYAAAKVFEGRRIFLLGEIIHNPDVNAQMSALGIRHLAARPTPEEWAQLGPEDVVIVPAFGAEVSTVARIREIGCQVVDTTCGDVMSVWKRVRQNAAEQVTSIIHGKSTHEETRATASQGGHYLIVLNLAEAQRVCAFIERGGDADEFIAYFASATSKGFDPAVHLQKIGVANQTTMLRGETSQIQALLREAVIRRDGGPDRFRFFDTICGATQDRQDALVQLLSEHLDLLLVIGGYNSSNTTHLVEIGSGKFPTYFVRNADCLVSVQEIRHFDLTSKQEIVSSGWMPSKLELTLGVTAGASCPNNLIEETIRRVLQLRSQISV